MKHIYTGQVSNEEFGIDVENFNMKEELKLFDCFRPHPTSVLLRLYMKPGETAENVMIDNQKGLYKHITGYVAKIGKCCFQPDGKGKQFEGWNTPTPPYKVGDWVAFQRHGGSTRFFIKGKPVFIVRDVDFLGEIDDPRDCTLT